MVGAWKLFFQNVFGPQISQRNNKHCYVIYYFTTFVRLCWYDAIDKWYHLLLQFVVFGEFYATKNSHLMIIDNSGIDYLRMWIFVFVFLINWKISPNSWVFSRLRQHLVYYMLQSSHANVVKKSDVRENNF